jgi:hypothetical protein
MATRQEIQALNDEIFDCLDGGDAGIKQAADRISAYTRTRMREDGYLQKFIPKQDVKESDFDRQLDTELPCIIVDKEPNSPAATTLPFGSMPLSTTIRGRRYRVCLCRQVTRRQMKDVALLATNTADIRQIISDNSHKDLLAVEDGAFTIASNAAMLGPDTPVPSNGGEVQWETIPGGITRESVCDAFKIMPRGPSSLNPKILLINNVTIHEFMKWGRDEMGGDISQDVIRDGWARTEFMKRELVVTIKREYVPDNSMFMYASTDFLGKHFSYEPTTMYIRREAYLIEFFSYQTSGCSLGHNGGVARADFEN